MKVQKFRSLSKVGYRYPQMGPLLRAYHSKRVKLGDFAMYLQRLLYRTPVDVPASFFGLQARACNITNRRCQQSSPTPHLRPQ